MEGVAICSSRMRVRTVNIRPSTKCAGCSDHGSSPTSRSSSARPAASSPRLRRTRGGRRVRCEGWAVACGIVPATHRTVCGSSRAARAPRGPPSPSALALLGTAISAHAARKGRAASVAELHVAGQVEAALHGGPAPSINGPRAGPPAGRQGGPNLTLCADRGRAMGCQLRSTARDLTSVLVT
jgi:hypothetical protein